ncbi:Alpha crystallin/Hsp20 domain [Macleaya cordata]|uniref:Alpha crystallin/Hsp20 domain n=1 Tax=Macleaya cordata TaxID=56857 RepID=A0A200RCS2_MACCD|nr:Alpha crystallin/Hsp20 domain [Macleaya cordata]
MSSAIANFTVSLPFSSERNVNSKPSSARFLAYFGPGSKGYSTRIKAVAGGERRDNLDHSQKAGKTQSTQQTKRAAQVAPPIGLWDRFPTARTVQQMMETMERMMDDPLAYSSTWPSTLPRENGNGGGYRRGRTPWDIKEGENDYKLRFDMPGMSKSDVKVWVEEKMLVVKAEKVPQKKEDAVAEAETEDVWSAKSYGRYSSRIALPENVEFEKIKAEVKDGVLYITIPKASTSSKVLDINVQ